MSRKEIIFYSLFTFPFALLANGAGLLGFKWQLTSVGLAYFIASLIIFRREPNTGSRIHKGLFIAAGYYVPLFISLLFSSRLLWPQVAPVLLMPALACIIAFIITMFESNKRRHALTGLIVATILILGLIGMPNYLNTVYSPQASKTYTFPRYSFTGENGGTVDSRSFKNKVVILDYWNTSCGICIKQMPKLEALNMKYYNDPRVEVYTVQLPVRTRDTTVKMVQPASHSFKIAQLYCNDYSAWEELSISGIPKYMILSDGNVIYTGTLNTAWYEFINRADWIIEEELSKL